MEQSPAAVYNDEDPKASPTNGFSISADQIFITDVGVGKRADAFYWLALGKHVYDHHFDELNISRLEREVDPYDVMNPVILRGYLWKKIHAQLWQYDDGHGFGPLPAQPGLDSHLSGIYYQDRRSRQASSQKQRNEQIGTSALSEADPVVTAPMSRPDARIWNSRSKSVIDFRHRSLEFKRGRAHSLSESPFSFSEVDRWCDDSREPDGERQLYFASVQSHDEYGFCYTKHESMGLDSAIDLESFEGISETYSLPDSERSMEELAQRLLKVALSESSAEDGTTRDVHDWMSIQERGENN